MTVGQAKHSPPRAKDCSEEDAEGLYPELFVSKGCRLMITSNLLTPFGLVNGTLGTLYDVVWRPDDNPLTTLPCLLLFKPDKYTGPSLFMDGGQPVIPILPIQREWEHGLVTYSRTMFPVVLAYAITIHKSQGLTLDKAVLDIRAKDFSLGQTYVAISRVRTVRGLMFNKSFDKSRFLEKRSETRSMREEDARNREAQGF